MKYYFENLEEQKKLKIILEEWRGTPWRHHCGVKGLGTDCIHFVGMVLKEMNLIKWRKGMVPDYPADWHLHNTRELLKDALEKEVRGEFVGTSNFMNGDIVLYHFGKASSHAAIYFDGYVYQALTGLGVKKINIKTKILDGKIKFNYRVLA